MLEKLLKSILAAVMYTAGNLLSGTIRFAADIHSACSHVSRRLLMLFIELRHLALISTSNTSIRNAFDFVISRPRLPLTDIGGLSETPLLALWDLQGSEENGDYLVIWPILASDLKCPLPFRQSRKCHAVCSSQCREGLGCWSWRGDVR